MIGSLQHYPLGCGDCRSLSALYLVCAGYVSKNVIRGQCSVSCIFLQFLIFLRPHFFYVCTSYFGSGQRSYIVRWSHKQSSWFDLESLSSSQQSSSFCKLMHYYTYYAYILDTQVSDLELVQCSLGFAFQYPVLMGSFNPYWWYCPVLNFFFYFKNWVIGANPVYASRLKRVWMSRRGFLAGFLFFAFFFPMNMFICLFWWCLIGYP